MNTKKSLAVLIPCILILNQLWTLGARAEGARSIVNFGLDFYSSTSASPPLGTMGFSLGFETGKKDTWISPTFGAALGYASGTDTLITGVLDGGVDAIAMGSKYLHPMVGVRAAFGWGHLVQPTQTSIGFLYGAIIEGGAEFKFTDDNKGKLFKIMTELKYMEGTLGALSGSALNSVTVSFGIVF